LSQTKENFPKQSLTKEPKSTKFGRKIYSRKKVKVALLGLISL